MRIVGVSGGLSAPSRTLGLVRSILDRLETAAGPTSVLHDLTDFGTAIGAVLDRRELNPVDAGRLADIAAADILVVGSPVFKAAYPGLFKHLFDLLDRDALERKVVILAANGASAHHALIIESHLRPLFSSLGAYTVPTGIYSQTSDFNAYALTNPAITDRIDEAVAEALDLQHRLHGLRRNAA